jgi:hypothetical protein
MAINISNGKDGGLTGGKPHSQGGTKAVIVDDSRNPIEVESGEVIINKRSVSANSIHSFDGKKMKNKEILSKINQEGGGIPIMKNGGEVKPIKKKQVKVKMEALQPFNEGDKNYKVRGIIDNINKCINVDTFIISKGKEKAKQDALLKLNEIAKNNDCIFVNIDVSSDDKSFSLNSSNKKHGLNNVKDFFIKNGFDNKDNSFKKNIFALGGNIISDRDIEYVGGNDKNIDKINEKGYSYIGEKEVNGRFIPLFSNIDDEDNYYALIYNYQVVKEFLNDDEIKKDFERWYINKDVALDNYNDCNYTDYDNGYLSYQCSINTHISAFRVLAKNGVYHFSNIEDEQGRIVLEYLEEEGKSIPTAYAETLKADETNEDIIEQEIEEENKHLKSVFDKGGKVKTDKNDNYIGDGSYHVSYDVVDLSDYPQVSVDVNKSSTTESVYVKYNNNDNLQSITVRFSNHENNAVKFGDQLDGNIATKNEILYRLGLMGKEFIPETFLFIPTRQVSKIDAPKYKEADLTIQEMYNLGEGADLSKYKGKLAKGSRYLIQGDTVKKEIKSGIDLGNRVVDLGKFIYKEIGKPDDNKQAFKDGGNINKQYNILNSIDLLEDICSKLNIERSELIIPHKDCSMVVIPLHEDLKISELTSLIESSNLSYKSLSFDPKEGTMTIYFEPMYQDGGELFANGGSIEPNKEVSASVKASIDDLIKSNWTELKPMEAMMLYNKFKNYSSEEGFRVEVKEDSLEYKVFENLEEKDFIQTPEDASYFDDSKELTEKGKLYIDSVNARYQTRIAVKKGYDMFPENANIKEIESKIKNKADLPAINEWLVFVDTVYKSPYEVENISPEEISIKKRPAFANEFSTPIKSSWDELLNKVYEGKLEVRNEYPEAKTFTYEQFHSAVVNYIESHKANEKVKHLQVVLSEHSDKNEIEQASRFDKEIEQDRKDIIENDNKTKISLIKAQREENKRNLEAEKQRQLELENENEIALLELEMEADQEAKQLREKEHELHKRYKKHKKDKELKVKKKFNYKGIELRIVDKEENYMNYSIPMMMTRVIAPNGGVLPININRKESLKKIMYKTISFLEGVEKNGHDVVKELTK